MDEKLKNGLTREEIAKQIYPAVNSNSSRNKTSDSSIATPSLDNRKIINLRYVLTRTVALFIIATIIGGIFGKGAIPSNDYMSELGNLMFGALVIGLGFIAFVAMQKFFDFWYLYPIFGFSSAGMVISRDKITDISNAGVSDHVVSIAAIFSTYIVIYIITQIIVLLNKKARITIVAACLMFAYCAGIYAVPFGANKLHQTYTDLGTVASPSLEGLTFAPSMVGIRIEYNDYYETNETITAEGNKLTKTMVTDSVTIRNIVKKDAKKACKSVYEINAKDESSKLYTEKLRTPSGIEYSHQTFETPTVKRGDGSMDYQNEDMYCFYKDHREYTLTREHGDDQTLPKSDVIEKAYAAYPVEKVIEAFFL